MSLLDAIYEDIAGNFVKAADCYEQLIQTACAPLEAYLNLAVLYWQCTDYGFNAGHKLDVDFIYKAGNRYQTLLSEANQCFPSHPEIRFWMLYCDYVTLGEPPFIEECKELVDTVSKSLVPYFYLYSSYSGYQYEKEANDLLSECLKYPTVKNRYIISVIQSVATRAKNKTRKEAAAV